MPAKQILVLGGGFAGLWSAVGAARKLDDLGAGQKDVRVTLVDRNPYHSIRVRNYERDLAETTVPLADVLEPIGVRHALGEVRDIDLGRKSVVLDANGDETVLTYDRLVFALGSQLAKPPIPGLAEHGFDVDTYGAAKRLSDHIARLPERQPSDGRNTVIVVGSGFTGLEVVTELPEKVSAAFGSERCRIILMDINPKIGPDIGDLARPTIEEALDFLGIERRLGVTIVAVGSHGVTLQSGEEIPADTVIWCAGLRAHPLTALFPVERDALGRMPVDAFMRVKGLDGVFAAGDSAWCFVEPDRPCVMSCQHGRPMGRFAGHNVVADLFALPMLALTIDYYVTVLDLGAWGALYTHGWDREVLSRGQIAKQTKQTINRRRIYPPTNRDRSAILAAAAPVIQDPPAELRGRQVAVRTATPEGH